jgi:predicted hydrocarbon binding protein
MAMASILKKLLIGRAFICEDGRIKLFGRMDWTFIPSKTLAVAFQDIGEKFGEDFLLKLGYEAGHDAGVEMVEYMKLKPKGGWVSQKAVIETLDFIGFGQMEFIKTDIKRSGHHHVILHIRNNPVIEHSIRLYGKKSLSCAWFRGVYNAHGELELGLKNVNLLETHCMKDGFHDCEWETKW